MASRDFGFLTLRSIQAYQSNGARAVPGSILTVGGIGDGIFSTSISPCTINVSTITINTETVCTIYIDTIAGVSTVNASTINTLALNSRCIDTSSINTSTITVSTLIALPTTTAINTLFVDGNNKLFYNGLVINTGVLSTVSTVYWEPAGNGASGVITNDNDGNPVENPLRYMVGIGTNFDTDVRSTLNGTLDIQYRGGDNTGNSVYVSSNGNSFAIRNVYEGPVQNGININLNDNQTAAFGPALHFNKSIGLATSQDGNELGYIEFDGTDTNNDLKRAAYIISHQQGAAGSGYVPGTLEFLTTADSATAGGVQRMIISSSGQIGMNMTPYKQLQVSTNTKDALDGIACNSTDVNTIIGAYAQGPFTGDNVGSIQVTRYNNSTTPYTLAVNPRGGDVYIGSSIASTFINGKTTISTLQVYTINGQVFDPTQDTHWTAYETTPGGPVNVYNANDGAVGVGTDENISANTKFQVNGNSLFQGTTRITSSLTVSSIISPLFVHPDTTNYSTSIAINSYGNFGAIDAFSTNNTSSKKDLILNAFGGNVGIGTTTPTSLLQVGSISTVTFYNTTTPLQSTIIIGPGISPSPVENTTPGINDDNYSSALLLASLSDAAPNVGTGIALGGRQQFNAEITAFARVCGVSAGPIEGDLTLETLYQPSGSKAGLIERMRIKNTGNVGIGTNNPQYTLDVAGSCYISSGLVINEVAYGGLKLEGGANENAMFIKDGTTVNPNQNDGYFVGNSVNFGGPSTFQIGRIDNGNDDSSKAIFMTQNGNVGIGTSAPAYKLDVIGSTQITWAGTRTARIGTSIPDEGFALTWNDIQAGGVNGQTELISGKGLGNGGFDFFVNVTDNTAAVAGDLAVRITADKKMGIATNNPQYTLDVNGTANISGNLTVTGSAISKVACIATQTLDANNFGKYTFINGDGGVTVTLPGGATDGIIIVIRNTSGTGSITVNGAAASSTILPEKTTSYLYTTVTNPSGLWYAL